MKTITLLLAIGIVMFSNLLHAQNCGYLTTIDSYEKSVCEGGSITFNVVDPSTDPQIQYNWTLVDTSTPVQNTRSFMVTPTQTSIYTLTVVNPSLNCSFTQNVTATINPKPIVSAGVDKEVCKGSGEALIATGALSYSWSPASTLSSSSNATVIATPFITTMYRVVGTNLKGCSNTDEVTVIVNPLPVLSVGQNATICQGTSTQLEASGALYYSWSPSTGLSNTLLANPIASPSQTTTYTLIASNEKGCYSNANTRVTITVLPVSVNAGADKTICEGSSVMLSATGATNYSWYPSTGLSSTTIANPVASPNITTNYTITTTAANGCVATDQVTVYVYPKPIVNAGPDVTICEGGIIRLNATGGTNYSWSPAAGLSSPMTANPFANPVVTTTYTITNINNYGCYSTDEVVVTVRPSTLNAGADINTCVERVTRLNASGAETYSWSSAASLSDPNIANPIVHASSGISTYTVTGTSAEGCVSTDEVMVTMTDVEVFVGNDQYICEGNSAQLSADGAVTYSWTPSTGLSNSDIANPIASPLQSTLYTVTGTSAEGCIAAKQVWVFVNPNPTVNAGADQVICQGADGVTLEATSSGAQDYSWSPTNGLSDASVKNPLANPLNSILYTLTVISREGCINSDQVMVNVTAITPINANNDQNICEGASTQLQAFGSPNYTYSWSPATGLSNPNIANPIVDKPNATITYTVTSLIGGCNSSDEMVITVIARPIIDAGPDKVICSGSDGVLLQANSTGAVTYDWAPATGLSSPNSLNTLANPTVTTVYAINAKGSTGCISSDKILVTVAGDLSVNAGVDQTICSGASVKLQASNGDIYSWTPTTGLSDFNIANPTVTPSSTTTYTVTSTNGSCTSSDQIVITVNQKPTIDAGIDKVVCSGSGVVLQTISTGTTSYSWSPATGLSSATSASPTINNLTNSTLYTVVATSAAGCTVTDQVLVTVTKPSIDAGTDKVICQGSNIGVVLQTTSTGATSYSWSPSAGLSSATSASPTAKPISNTLYTITAKSAAGCTNTDQVLVTVSAKPLINAGADKTICEGVATTLNAIGGVSYSWSPAIGLSSTTVVNPIATLSSTITYTVTGANEYGCTNSDQVVINVKPKPVFDLGPDQKVCKGSTAKLIASGGVTYTWQGDYVRASQTRPNEAYPLPIITTTYTVTVLGANGCSAIDNATVIVNSIPVVNAGPDQTICGVPAVAQLSATGAAAYKWAYSSGQTISGQIISDLNISNPTVALERNSTTSMYTVNLMVKGTSAEGCSATDYVNIRSSRSPQVIVTPDQTICSGSSATLYILPFSSSIWLSPVSNDMKSIVWTSSSGFVNTSASKQTITPELTTTYKVTGYNGYGCSVSKQVVITVSSFVSTLNAGPDKTLCSPKSNLEIPAPTGVLNYDWEQISGDGGYSYGGPSSPITVYPTITSVYRVRGTTAAGCIGSDELTVFVNPSTINAGVDQTICGGSSANLNAISNTNGTTYKWFPSTGLSSTIIANPVAMPTYTTTYTVISSVVGGCTVSDQVKITISSKPSVNAGPDKGLCTAASATLYGSIFGISNFSWSPVTGLSDPNIANPVANPETTTTYTLTGTNEFGCSASDQVTVYRGVTPIVNAGADQISCTNSAILIASSNIPGGAYKWTSNPTTSIPNSASNSITVAPRSVTTYTVRHSVNYPQVGFAFSCSATDNVTVGIIPTPTLSNNNHNFQIITGTLPLGTTIVDVKWYWSIDVHLIDFKLYNSCSGTSTSCYNANDQWRSWRAKILYDINGASTCEKYTEWLYIPGIIGNGGDGNPFDFGRNANPSNVLIVYPIPADKTLTLEFNSESATIAEISIQDMMGNNVLHVFATSNQKEVDVSSLPTGIYILRLKDSNDNMHVKKIELKK